ncbi:MAG TPA: hypothetical protein ENI12_05910, partial [Nitrospirae bacterium]|nr:hypothetical protein [Nitrospirota bacterium]
MKPLLPPSIAGLPARLKFITFPRKSETAQGSYIPRFMVLEASVYPMPIAGVLVKSNADQQYKNGGAINHFNVIQAITEGFEEPWAVSLFLGNVMNFKRAGSPEMEGGNKGFMGYLLSAGN